MMKHAHPGNVSGYIMSFSISHFSWFYVKYLLKKSVLLWHIYIIYFKIFPNFFYFTYYTIYCRWFASPWQPCTVTCGAGVGIQLRIVTCLQTTRNNEEVLVSHTACRNLTRPINKRRCSMNEEIPCPVWRVSDWNDVSI